ncbi:MAG: 30S ribosomal protein S9 [Candidatus Lightella neohaematopini]|nr:30S ribosomal protein S9 [Candidatus Lightella neohaematopini]MCV2531084.1 30S ribosomal protein S9 [Candidatus Lightella neohaematopini]
MSLCYYGTGRRKSSIARIFLKEGNNKIIINNIDINKYYNKKIIIFKINQVLSVVNLLNKFNIYITVKGGGILGQANAIKHGISRALITYNNKLYRKLRESGFITRDSRIVERKKVGLKKSRCRPQFSKR